MELHRLRSVSPKVTLDTIRVKGYPKIVGQSRMNKIIFLDRDGVINQYPGDGNYVTTLEDFTFLPGACEALVKLFKAGFKIFVISNQAGVTKGLYTQKTLDEITKFLTDSVDASGGHIEDVFYCLHTEEQNCDCRKPKIGLIKKALRNVSADLSKTFFIGDSIRDIQTGKAAGCKTILVLSGKERLQNRVQWHEKPDYVAADLSEAVEVILEQKDVQ